MQSTDLGPRVPPTLHIAAEEHERLIGLAQAHLKRFPEAAERLLAEADRAVVLPADRLPRGVVTMGSYVEFRDEESGDVRCVQLVYPGEADIAQGRISVMTLIGAALIGLSAGQSITWPKRRGEHRRLTVLRASPVPF